MTEPILSFRQVSKVFDAEGEPLAALRDITLDVPAGSIVALVGRSGSGKTTLLHLAAGIETPSTGSIRVLGREITELGDRERTLLRRRNIGLVFQFFHLLPHLTVRENVALPEWIDGRAGEPTRDRVDRLLDRVGLLDRRDSGVHRLSGGEMQRVAICRALLNRPRLLLADEPTGNLDDENGRIVMDMLHQLVREEESTLIYATHSRELAELADETWALSSGVLERA